MKKRTIVSLLLALAFIVPLTVRADQDKDRKDRDDRHGDDEK